MCTDGPSCRRRVCFFAHYEHELRRAEEYPPLLNQQLHAGLVAGARGCARCTGHQGLAR